MNQMSLVGDARQGPPPQRERRNKKKRPADYYKKLEERERLAAAEQRDDGSRDQNEHTLNTVPAPHSMTGISPVTMPVNMSMPPPSVKPCFSFSPMMPPVPPEYPSQLNVGIPNQQDVHNSSNSISFVANMEPTQQEETDKNNSAIGALPVKSSAQTIEPTTNRVNTIHTQTKPPDVSMQSIPPKTDKSPGTHPMQENFGFSISFGSVEESHLVKKKSMSQLTSDDNTTKVDCGGCDSIQENKETPNNANVCSSTAAQIQKEVGPNVDNIPQNTSIQSCAEKSPEKNTDDSVESVKATLPVTIQGKQTNSTSPAPEKPKSWASLLHGTSTANSATVVYDTKTSASSVKSDAYKDNSSEKKESSPSPDMVVAASEDKNAGQLGGKVLFKYPAIHSGTLLIYYLSVMYTYVFCFRNTQRLQG